MLWGKVVGRDEAGIEGVVGEDVIKMEVIGANSAAELEEADESDGDNVVEKEWMVQALQSRELEIDGGNDSAGDVGDLIEKFQRTMWERAALMLLLAEQQRDC
ncbi:hypothetical protein PoB_006848100 [Plakobranchus ocellatus]|uniref:Uncharacterized protein n=1 Tax=Plakobranchus ocellatus TaxID=259542 RepID=A0AAV4DD14_9GAST|nr:hypothetical protein PoB_006848100 [Plakobranchus ocellatus]